MKASPRRPVRDEIFIVLNQFDFVAPQGVKQNSVSLPAELVDLFGPRFYKDFAPGGAKLMASFVARDIRVLLTR